MKTTFRRLALALATAVLAGCSTQTDLSGPAENPASSHLLRGDNVLVDGVVQSVSATLMTCRSMPFAQSSAVIGAAGGTVRLGPHTLVIPRGALSSSTRITFEIPSGEVSSVQFGPAGLQFAKPATLTMSYAHCQGLDLLVPRRIVYTTDRLAILEILRSADDPSGHTVSTLLDHFSRYAVAY